MIQIIKNQIIKLTMVIFLLNLIIGCVTSEQPVASPRVKDPAYQLLGTWINIDGWHNHEYLHIVIDFNKHMHLIRVTHPVSNRGAGVRVDEFYIFRTQVGKQLFMNVELDFHPGDVKIKSKQYFIVKYEIDKKGYLRIWPLKSLAIKKVIKLGYMQGKVWTKNKKENIKLNVSSAKLQSWVRNANTATEYGKPLVYRQIQKAPFREY